MAIIYSNVVLSKKGFIAVGTDPNKLDRGSVMQEYDYRKNEWTTIGAPLKAIDNRYLVWISKNTFESLIASADSNESS